MITLLKALAFTGGEWVIYVLIFCSVLALAVVIERGIVLAKERKQILKVKALFSEIENGAADSGKITQSLEAISGLSATIVRTGFFHMGKGPEAIEEYVRSVTSGERRRLEVRMIVLGTLGNNAIYIGLFGTVLGVIKAFRDLAQAGSGPEIVMQGLSEALIATAVGLMVALPCVIAYNVFQKQIGDLISETESMVQLLLAQVKSKNDN